MKPLLTTSLLLTALALVMLSVVPVRSTQNLPDYILLIDTSGSMKKVLQEELSGTSIIDYVKGVASDLARTCVKGSRVFVYTFDDGIRSEKSFRINDESSRQKLVDYIQGLKADGQRTRIFSSLEYIAKKHKTSPENANYALLFVYTDGIDTSKDTPESAIEFLKSNLTERGYSVYYTTFGRESLKESEKKKLESDLGQFYAAGIPLTETPPGPIVTVTPLEGMLDFGNLRVNPNPTQDLTFYALRPASLTDSFRLDLTFESPDLSGTNHFLRPVPESVRLSTSDHYSEQSIGLSVSNLDSTLDGEHFGYLKLSDASPLVVVAPDSIPIVFRFEAERKVVVHAVGMEKPEFGLLNPYNPDESRSKEYKLTFDFNESAQKRSGHLYLVLERPEKEAESADSDIYFLIDGQRTDSAVVTPAHRDITLAAEAGPSAPAGDFKAKLTGLSRDMTVEFPGVEVAKNEFTLPVTLSVASRPWPAWKWALVVLVAAILLFIVVIVLIGVLRGENPIDVLSGMFSAFKSVTIPDATLSIRKPAEASDEVLNIRGRREVRIGSGGEFAPNAADAAVSLFGVKKNGKVRLVARTVRGEASMKTIEEKDAFPLIESELYDGDILLIGNFELEITSLSLIRI